MNTLLFIRSFRDCGWRGSYIYIGVVHCSGSLSRSRQRADQMNSDEATPAVGGTDNSDIQLQEINGNAQTKKQADDQSSAPDKEYYFGCGSCHPRWLQCFADGKCYTFILSLFVIVEGAIVSGNGTRYCNP